MEIIEVSFPKLNHFWLDSGLLGLSVPVTELDSDVERTISDSGVTLKGTEDGVKTILNAAYDLLISRYYDISTKKQIDDETLYNFYYDSQADKFVAFPKKKSVGIAELIFNKAPRPKGSSLKWVDKIKEKQDPAGWVRIAEDEKLPKGQMTRVRHILPPSHETLQKPMDEFLQDPWTGRHHSGPSR